MGLHGRVAGGRAPVWNVPHDRLTHFVGRRPQLDSLLTAAGPRTISAPRALTGPGGVGKTQLAVELAYANRDDFDVVWWVRAERAVTLAVDLADLGQALGLSAAQADIRGATREVRAWLDDHDRWMVVIDNAPDAASVGAALRLGGGGHVLVTSRADDWGDAAEVVAVDVLAEDDAVDYLLGVTGESDPGPARALAGCLGCLPLALEKAAAYVVATPGLDVAGYVEVFRQWSATLAPDDGPRAYPRSIAVTCGLAVERVEQQCPPAATLLRACSFLAPETVPIALLSDVDELPEPLPSGPLAQRDALAALCGLGLARSTWRGGIAVDRDVQAVVRDRLAGAAGPVSAPPGGPLGPWAAGVVRLVDRAFPADGDDPASRGRGSHLLPHALAATAHVGVADVEPQATSRLLARVGIHLQGRGHLDEARRLLERSLAIVEIAYGPDDPEAAIHLGNLALVLHDQGDLDGARVCLGRAIDIAVAAHGPDHPAVATLAGNLGSVLGDLGDLAAARSWFERALAIDEPTYGPDHPAVAGDLTNLALVLWRQGEAADAYRCFDHARAIDEAAYGPDDPSVARDLANLALVRADAGELAEARVDLERALAIVESAFGPHHVEVRAHLTNLATVLHDGGDREGARACLERALAIAEHVDGPAHPTVADVLTDLGSVLSDLGDASGARQCFERALAIDEAALGPDHPDVGFLRRNRDRSRALGDLGADE